MFGNRYGIADGYMEGERTDGFGYRRGCKGCAIGFGLSLEMNEKAMEHYSRMTEAERKSWLEKAGQVQSKAEMEKLVSRIGETFQ